jgi:cation transport ATPase
MNQTGNFRFRATKAGKDTALAQIIHLVQGTQGSKAPIQRIVDQVSHYFVPTVMILAMAAACSGLRSDHLCHHAAYRLPVCTGARDPDQPHGWHWQSR